MMKDVPLLTGRIDAFPTLMFMWNCPKCGAFHFKVQLGDVVQCLNKKCGEKFDRARFRFVNEEKIARVLATMKESMYKVAVAEAEAELKKEEEADAVASS